MVRPLGAQPDAGAVVQPQTAPLRLFAGHLQPLAPPQALDPLVVDLPAGVAQQGGDPPVSVTANVIANAFQDRVPMVVLTGCVSASARHGYTHQVLDMRDLALAIPVVVFVDPQLGLIELKQRELQLPGLAVELGATDFPAVARALGGEGVRVRDRDGLAHEIEAALSRDAFTILAAEIGRCAYDGRI